GTSNVATDARSSTSLRKLLLSFALVLGASSMAAAQDEDEPDPQGDETPEPAIPEQTAYVVAVPTSDELESVTARVGAAARASLRRIDGVRWQRPDQAYLGYSDFMLERLNRGR